MDYVLPFIQYGCTKTVDGEYVFTEIRKAYIQGVTALTANPMRIRYKVSLGNCCNTTYYILSDFSYKEQSIIVCQRLAMDF